MSNSYKLFIYNTHRIQYNTYFSTISLYYTPIYIQGIQQHKGTQHHIGKYMIKLYWNVGSQPARAVKALLELGHIKHETIEIDLGKSQTRSPQYLKINPFGQIPFLVTETGLGIGQSNAIMQYLCEKYPSQLIKYYGTDLQSRTRVNTVLSWYQSYFRPSQFGRIKLKVYGTIKNGIPFTQAQQDKADKQLGEGLMHLQRMLKDQEYVAGDYLSIADLLVYFQATNIVYYEMESVLKDLERVSKWYHRVSQVPEVKAINEQWQGTVKIFKDILASAQPVK